MGEEAGGRDRARLSAEGTADGSGLVGTMPPPSNPPPQQHAQRRGRGKSEGHSLAEPLDRHIQSCRRFVLGRDRKREKTRDERKGGRSKDRPHSGRAKQGGAGAERPGEATGRAVYPQRQPASWGSLAPEDKMGKDSH